MLYLRQAIKLRCTTPSGAKSLLDPQYSTKPVNNHISPYLPLTNLIIKAAYFLMCQICPRKSPTCLQKDSLTTENELFIMRVQRFRTPCTIYPGWHEEQKLVDSGAHIHGRNSCVEREPPSRVIEIPVCWGPYRQSRLTLTNARILTPCGPWRQFSWFMLGLEVLKEKNVLKGALRQLYWLKVTVHFSLFVNCID